MRRIVVLVAVLSGVAVAWFAASRSAVREEGWTASFRTQAADLAATGRNPWFVLEPGYVLVLEDGDDRLTITVLDETRTIDGVETRVVEERESEAGRLVEVSRNFFAIDRRTNDVLYFGEEVDLYEGGEVVGHEGAWLAGADGARYGLAMPGTPLIGARYYQEVAPGVALDRAEVGSVRDTLTTPAGRFENVLRIEETTPLEPGVRESKYYAAGVGLLRDGALRLVRHGPAAG